MTEDTSTHCHSLKGAARRLGVSLRTIERMVANGEIESRKVSKRRRIIPMREINRILGEPNASLV